MHTPGFTFLKLLRLRRAKSRADSRLVRTMAGDSRNLLKTWKFFYISWQDEIFKSPSQLFL